MLYQLPMENTQMRKNKKLLQISLLHETGHNTLWKIIGEGMESDGRTVRKSAN